MKGVIMSLYKYRIFKAVVQYGSFTAAAEKLGYTQSGISHAMNSLENEFGFKLVLRSRNGITITPNGEEILEYIREITNWNDQLDQAVASINGQVKGKIRIGTFISIAIKWLPTIIKDFSKEYPLVEFQIIDGDSDDIQDWILDYKVDCGFASFTSPHKNLKVTSLKEDLLKVVLPENHPFTQMDKVALSTLNNEHFIVPGEGMGADVGEIIKRNDLDLNILYQTKSDHATLAMVENGIGISILPELLLNDVQENIVSKEFEEKTFRTLSFATLKSKQRTALISIFEAHVKRYIEEL